MHAFLHVGSCVCAPRVGMVAGGCTRRFGGGGGGVRACAGI
jgi:hypothetical protein